jgi:hypothetical protein
VVDDPARQRQFSLLVDDRDLRTPAVQVNADPTITVTHVGPPSPIVRPRGRNPRGLNPRSSGRRADFLPPARAPAARDRRSRPALHDINLKRE